MTQMNPFKRVILAGLYVVVLSVLLMSSCIGPGVVYSQSPYLFLHRINPDEVVGKSFFVAFMEQQEGKSAEIKVVKAGTDLNVRYPGANYHLPPGHHSFSWDNDGSATIDVDGSPSSRQQIRVFVIGDTPWTSLSEYQVENNAITPLRHAHSVGWFLLGSLILPLVVIAFASRLRRLINRSLGA